MPMLIGIPYQVTRTENDPERYDTPMVYLVRADGYAGNVTVSGVGADELEKGKTYVILPCDAEGTIHA